MKTILVIAALTLSASSFAAPPTQHSNIFNDIKNKNVLAQALNKQDLIEIISQHNDESNQLVLPTSVLLSTLELIPSQSGSATKMAALIKPKQVVASE